MSGPDDVPDFFPEQLDSVDDILSSDARVMEEFATGQKVKNIKQNWTTASHPEPLLVRGRGKVYVLELIIDAEFEDLP